MPGDFRDWVMTIDLFAESVRHGKYLEVQNFVCEEHRVLIENIARVECDHSRWRRYTGEFSSHVKMSFPFQKAVAVNKADVAIFESQ